jgi:hypothetical protein
VGAALRADPAGDQRARGGRGRTVARAARGLQRDRAPGREHPRQRADLRPGHRRLPVAGLHRRDPLGRALRPLRRARPAEPARHGHRQRLLADPDPDDRHRGPAGADHRAADRDQGRRARRLRRRRPRRAPGRRLLAGRRGFRQDPEPSGTPGRLRRGAAGDPAAGRGRRRRHHQRSRGRRRERNVRVGRRAARPEDRPGDDHPDRPLRHHHRRLVLAGVPAGRRAHRLDRTVRAGRSGPGHLRGHRTGQPARPAGRAQEDLRLRRAEDLDRTADCQEAPGQGPAARAEGRPRLGAGQGRGARCRGRPGVRGDRQRRPRRRHR